MPPWSSGSVWELAEGEMHSRAMGYWILGEGAKSQRCLFGEKGLEPWNISVELI